MRINIYAIYSTVILIAVSLITSICLNQYGYEFSANLFSGIFASGILTFLMSVIGYLTERKRTLERFYSYAQKATSNLNRYENDGDVDRTIEVLLQMNQHDYLELDNAYGDIKFLFFDKRNREYIYSAIYFPIQEVSELIAEKAYHFKNYLKEKNGNRQVMQIFILEIDNKIMRRWEEKISEGDEHTITMSCIENKLVLALRKELSGRYFQIMYPLSKKESTNAN